MNFVLLSSIILALNILFIQFSRYKAESLFEIRVSIFKQLLKYWKPTSKFPLCVKGCKFFETRRATQRCSFCVPTMLNPLGSKFEQDEEWCAALYISTRKQQRQSIVQILVGSSGLEPPTSRLSGVRSNHLSYEPSFGGDERVRTDDPLLAKQVLSQLSYTPV